MTQADRNQSMAYWRQRVLSHVGSEPEARDVLETMCAWLVSAHWDIEQWEARARQHGYKEPELIIKSTYPPEDARCGRR